ncbi:cytochrome oxidase c subunit VIb-domain-containing protein [Amylostereum chailletii]|nr:cytochrome oxidase c subunit VIb-domain-containing protein [Amylostereum chailletii]
MGWFSWSSKPESPTAVSRQDRAKCWEARDAYFACLDGARVVVAGSEGGKCAPTHSAYEHNCAKSWIEYFNKRRVLAERQKPILEQAAMQAGEARKKT